MWFGEPQPFPERVSPTGLSASGQQRYEGWSCIKHSRGYNDVKIEWYCFEPWTSRLPSIPDNHHTDTNTRCYRSRLIVNDKRMAQPGFYFCFYPACGPTLGPTQSSIQRVKGKAIPLQAWTGPEGSRWLRLPDFKTIGIWMW